MDTNQRSVALGWRRTWERSKRERLEVELAFHFCCCVPEKKIYFVNIKMMVFTWKKKIIQQTCDGTGTNKYILF